MNVWMEAPVVELPWWLDYLNALAWAGTYIALLVAAFFFWRTQMLRTRSEIRLRQWEALARAIEQGLEARDCRQLQIRMLILAHLARQHEFRFDDAQLLADVNAVLARRIVGGELCSGSVPTPEVIAGFTAFEGEGGARLAFKVLEKRWVQEGQGSLGVIRVEALQREVPYSSPEERVLLELSNELQYILSRLQH